MSSLEICELGDLIEFQRGYDLPKSSFIQGKYPVQSSNGILGYHNEYKVKGPGITIGRSGTVGIPHLIKKNFFPHNTVLFIKDFKGNDIDYIYYLLKSLNLIEMKTGSGVPTMNRNHLHPLKIKAIRKLEEQRSIAWVLSLLDQKIELNNKINKELETMAKTLYDYWFVQFDFPDENGKPYKSSGGKMEYNSILKREIPLGWEVKKIKDIAKTASGGTPLSSKSEYYQGGNIPWINSGEVNSSFIISTKNYITDLGLNNSNAKIFDKNTILIAMYGATAGKVSFIDFPASTNQAICAINPHEKEFQIYLKIHLEKLYKYLVNLSSGSARDNLSQEKINSIDVICPNKNIISEFNNLCQNLMISILINMKQNKKLNQTRDWLLPMLMNGQVKID
ncbi:restriction endonuclease subunit S [Thorsellia anophelis]|uniref:Type I restriction enzyme, S subunit n=1 Tax=Thorsellia anophelis DSM 18579 TaxID=1123402 RepID=A0A1I0CX01_9GAMM|nr:restriction endonuclease subunit S [Thorsellia anophelis]SET24101.1 type I restriction enzyme, S subunit [Thorsellia anophelis DSM 18579]